MPDVPDNLTIIPMTNAALRAVDTPFVAFEHAFKTRPAWHLRQMEGFRRNSAFVMLGDTWPDAYHAPVSWGVVSNTLKSYDKPQSRHSVSVWPETAIYHTGVAKMFAIDESIRYRPQMQFFGQYYDSCAFDIRHGDDVEISPEAAIYVDDRNIYPVTYPTLYLPPAQMQLSVVSVGEDESQLPSDLHVVQMSDDRTIPAGKRFNDAVLQTASEYVAVVVAGYTNVLDRLELQLRDRAALSLGAVITPDGLEQWLPQNHVQLSDVPSGQLATMMFHRSVFERLGGACEELPEGFEYDLFLRVVSAGDLPLAYHTDGLVRGEPYVCRNGAAYTQQVYNDAANRLRYTKGYHGPAIQK